MSIYVYFQALSMPWFIFLKLKFFFKNFKEPWEPCIYLLCVCLPLYQPYNTHTDGGGCSFLMPVSLTAFNLWIKALVYPFTKHHSHSTTTGVHIQTTQIHFHTLSWYSNRLNLLCFGRDATRCKRAESRAEDWADYNLIYSIIDAQHFTQKIENQEISESWIFNFSFWVFYFPALCWCCRTTFHWDYSDIMWCVHKLL